MRKYFVASIIILTFACAPKNAPDLNTVTYNAIIAETALLNIQTIAMDLDKSGSINKSDATRIMNNIRKTNETMKLVSQSLKTWNQFKDNGSTLKTILPILKENMAELKKVLPANMQAMAAVIEIFVNFDGWYGPVKEAF